MDAAAFVELDRPRWQTVSRQRFLVGVLLATAMLASLVLIRFSPSLAVPDRLDVRLVPATETPSPPVEAVAIVPIIPVAGPANLLLPEAAPDSAPAPAETPSAGRDWQQQIVRAAAATPDFAAGAPSVNPGFDTRRRAARQQFRGTRATPPRPIWENVERDQLGRTILVSGDCWRVVDDPSAVNAEVFREFQQYIVQCRQTIETPRELPWVDEIRQRYDYLQPAAVDD